MFERGQRARTTSNLNQDHVNLKEVVWRCWHQSLAMWDVATTANKLGGSLVRAREAGRRTTLNASCRERGYVRGVEARWTFSWTE